MSATGDLTWLVAVDDDPTGCQSVSGVPLLTAWDDETLLAAARRRAPVTFVLTNSRSMPEHEAVRVNTEVGAALQRAAVAAGLRLRLISRSDSTLRGHFPAEVDALARGASIAPDGIVLCPAFFEAGRYTASGIHWVQRDGELIPACRTEFARDATFGFHELTLADWARARGAPDDVVDIGLAELTTGDQDAVVAKLMGSNSGQAIVVNAMNYDHLRAFDSAARSAEAGGRRFVYRTGPSFVRAAAGLGAPALAELDSTRRAGIVVVGSHTDVTNQQVADAITNHRLDVVELDAALVLDAATIAEHIAATATRAVQGLQRGSVVLRTSRSVITAGAARTPLEISRTIASALTDIVRRIAEGATLGWVIAKGGITSHELLTSAFGVRTAEVSGQALPGIVPVLDIAIEGTSTPYVIFPGNVGDHRTLSRILDRLVGP